MIRLYGEDFTFLFSFLQRIIIAIKFVISGNQILDADNLTRLKSGDQALFSELVRDHHRALIALATPIVGSSEAEEVVQNAWVKAYKGIANFEGKAKIRSWLSRIVINEAKMQIRGRKKELLFTDFGDTDKSDDALTDCFNQEGSWQKPPISWHFDSPESLLMGTDFEHCLEQLLSEMPDSQRAMLEMRDTCELPFEEICNNLSVSASNARVLLHRARTQLFKLINHYQETGEC